LKRANQELQHPPIFIVGPPRSGTTLLYQLLVQKFHVAYFPNFADLLNKAPVTATNLARIFSKPYESNFESNYGRVSGKLAPSEAGGIWNRWYPYESQDGFNYVSAEYLSEENRHAIYQTVVGIESQFKAPLVNKNVKHSVRIGSLDEVFPNSLFLQVTRDPEEIAVSILHGRKKRTEDIQQWWSAMPKEIDELREKDVLEQIAGQVYYIEKNIKEDIEQIGRDRLCEVPYEELCRRPREVLEEIKDFVKSHGCLLNEKFEVPKAFPKSKKKKDVSAAELSTLRDLLAKLYREESETRLGSE
jgi:hypothetical protein